MAQPALDFFIRRGFLLKTEPQGTEGTDSVPVNTTDGILLLNGSSGTTFEKRERQTDRAVFGAFPFAVANKGGFVEGDFELFPPATPGQASTSSYIQEVLLTCAGFDVVKNVGSKTTKYSPRSSGILSASGYWWHVDASLHVLGCRNDLKSLKIEIGQIFMGKAHIQGNYSSVTKQTMPAITMPYTTVPVTASYANTEAWIKAPEGGSELLVWAKSLEITMGSDLKSKEYSSVKRNAIAGRTPTWKMRIAKTDLADFNPVNLRDAGTFLTGRMRTSDGTIGAGLYSELGFRGQIETIEDANVDGDMGWDIGGPCVPSNAATEAVGDEFYILFGGPLP